MASAHPVSESPPSLSGCAVAITGRLQCMTRPEAVAALEAAGARFVAVPDGDTTWLLVGRGGPPLGEDGRLTASLRRARELQAQGIGPRVLSEEAFLAAVGRGGRDELQRLYTVDQVARLLEVPRARVRAWTRQGLLRPVRVEKRLAFYDFRQVTGARALVDLLEQGVGPARLRESLRQLAGWWDEDGAGLAQLEVLARGDVAVRLPDGHLADPGGQLRLAFDAPGAPDAGADDAEAGSRLLEVGGLAPEVGDDDATGDSSEHTAEDTWRGDGDGAADSTGSAATGDATGGSTGDATGARVAETASQAEDAASDDAWFDRGVAAEDAGDLRAALDAYTRAEAAGDAPEEAAFNAGNCLVELERWGEAAAAYRRAVSLDGEYVEAWNNLGVALGEAGETPGAVSALRRAVALAPDYADAHYNLAQTLDASGNRVAAVGHWKAFLRLAPDSPSASEARARLQGG